MYNMGNLRENILRQLDHELVSACEGWVGFEFGCDSYIRAYSERILKIVLGL